MDDFELVFARTLETARKAVIDMYNFVLSRFCDVFVTRGLISGLTAEDIPEPVIPYVRVDVVLPLPTDDLYIR